MEFSIDEIVGYMKSNFRDITVKELAAHFVYSESRFIVKFKEEMGVSPKEYLAAIKLEHSVEDLIDSDGSVLSTHLKNGYISEGTFTNTVKRAMMIPPSRLRTESSRIQEEYLKSQEIPVKEDSSFETRVHIFSERPITGVVFVGLFEKPLPTVPPVVGKVIMNYKKRNYVDFNNVPPGDYYVMAVELAQPDFKRNLFIHKANLRVFLEESIHFPYKGRLILNIREPLEKDPPIVLNLPMLLFETIRNRTMEYRRDRNKER